MITQKLDNFMIWVGTQIFFGKPALEHLPEGIGRFGKRVLIVYGGGSIKKNGVYDTIVNTLNENGIFHCEVSGVQPNPKVDVIRKGIAIGKENKVDVVLAVGDGSVVDTAKAISLGCSTDCDIMDAIKVNGGNILSDKVLPTLCVLTLPATGSEMATGAVFVGDDGKKTSFHGPYIRPRVSFLNPEFTFSLPEKQTKAGSADIWSHIIESYFSNEKCAYLQARTAEGMMKTLLKYVPIALKEPENYEARANIMYCGAWGNNGYIVKGNYVSWSVHMLEQPLNDRFHITHGEGLAIITPHWLRWAKRPENLYRYVDFGVNVFGIDPSLPEEVIAEKGIEALEHYFFEVLKMPRRLRDLGVTDDCFEECCEIFNDAGMRAYQADAFVPLTQEAGVEILKAAY